MYRWLSMALPAIANCISAGANGHGTEQAGAVAAKAGRRPAGATSRQLMISL
jgi:hypothetical protein